MIFLVRTDGTAEPSPGRVGSLWLSPGLRLPLCRGLPAAEIKLQLTISNSASDTPSQILFLGNPLLYVLKDGSGLSAVVSAGAPEGRCTFAMPAEGQVAPWVRPLCPAFALMLYLST